jgi:serine/threonine-protein kinase
MADLRVRGYELIEWIGRGASSEVYKARQLNSGQVVALKIVRRGSGEGARQFAQLANEFRVARQWTHPNLVRLHELATARLLFWKLQVALAMEYVPGETLKSGKSFTALQFVDCYIQLAEAMHYMHQHGYIHLDMKPQNVMVTQAGQAKIMDFGLCTRKGKYNPRVQGTPNFMAPEQLRKGWVDERTDVFNLGATLFTVVSGKSVQMMLTSCLRTDGGPAVVSETFQSRSVEVSPDLESLILQSCRPSPAERPATMARVLEKLQDIRSRLAPPKPVK